ncbi:HRDC domain-containing protein [Allobranchiibius sp. CTAmp26]|uniref:HRDC domain-containing protein n=1 Tax=Allobranchiibius sp. CTAmp26 TaxID=2815214 RepID=UPI001AA1D4B8|nr:HRDC domain-containing protein [Allobranchiibius sp. CTAmp26]MBO1755400.1 ribonuclease D [Allobranchiibius sp. CTAmp26]
MTTTGDEAPAEGEGAAAEDVAPSYPMLESPADGVPDVIVDERALTAAAAAIAAGHGPVALDAERASGFRYGNRAYLVQLRREGAGLFLIDPIACPDLSPIDEAIGDAEWVLHAATQDLACLAEVGLRPKALFDTELGGRIAGLKRVGLAAVIEHYLGVTLAKEHSAADWSTRPLPEPWLRYAALDVEVLVQVRDLMYADLAASGKLDWALQDFEALLSFTGPPVRTDPWRRTSGMHKIRERRALARVRELWQTRDALARERDIAPGRLLPDALIVAMATTPPTSADELTALGAAPPAPGAPPRRSRKPHHGLLRYQRDWLAALERVGVMSERALPPASVRGDGPPPVRAWADRNPVAAARLSQVRDRLGAYGEEHGVPLENLVTPESLRRLIWNAPNVWDERLIREQLASYGARPWQVDAVTPLVVQAVEDHPVTDE